MAEQRKDPGTGRRVGDPTTYAGTGLPPPPPPPKPKEKTKPAPSKGSAFQSWMDKHPQMRAYAPLIWKWAAQYNVDPVYLASLIYFESGGDPRARSSANAYGLGQTHLPTWAGKRTPWGDVISEKWLQNPNNAIRFTAWYWSQQVEKYGDPDTAYRKGYNPGYTGKGPFQDIPPRYVPRSGALSPTEAASTSVERAGATRALTDPWVVVVKGKVKFVRGDQPPKNALLVDGLPITRSVFLAQRRELEDTWVGFTGKRPTNEQVANFLKKGWSVTTLQVVLSKSRDFVNSPVYKSVAPAYIASAEGLLAPGEKVDPDLIRQAVVYRWNGDTFQSMLRKRPGYVKSTEFKGKASTLANVYMSIYGTPNDPQELAAIREATLGGWSLDQFAGWLRARPEYTRSSEYQTKMIGFLDQLGLITGQVPVLKPGQAPKNTNPNIYGPLPDDPRIKDKAGIDPDNNMAVTFGG